MDEWLTFASLAKRVFVQNHLYENACHLYILLKIKLFSCEMICKSIRSKERQGKKQLRSGSEVCI